jgi:hypothetical protein
MNLQVFSKIGEDLMMATVGCDILSRRLEKERYCLSLQRKKGDEGRLCRGSAWSALSSFFFHYLGVILTSLNLYL